MHRTGYYFQLRLQWTGQAAIDKVLTWAKPMDETLPGCPRNEECVVVSGPRTDYFTYEIEPCALSITTQPVSQDTTEGSNLVFTVAHTGGHEPVAVQWFKDGAELSNGGIYSGVTTATLVITSATTDAAGTYYAVLTDSAASPCVRESNIATLTVGSSPPIYWDDGNDPPNPSCEGSYEVSQIYSAYVWGVAPELDPNGELDGQQLGNAMALWANERTTWLEGRTVGALSQMYWQYFPTNGVYLSGLHKAAAENTDPEDPEGNVSVLFAGGYRIAQLVCMLPL